MQYAVLIYEKPGYQNGLSDAERQQITAEYIRIRQDQACLDGAKLTPIETATTVRVQDGDTLVTDGPFANTKEVFAGYYVFEADDLDTMLQIAARLPAARLGGSAEIRPVAFRAQTGADH